MLLFVVQVRLSQCIRWLFLVVSRWLFDFPPAMSNWAAKDSEWQRWYPQDDIFLLRAKDIMQKGLPCLISVKQNLEQWDRITLVLTPETG